MRKHALLSLFVLSLTLTATTSAELAFAGGVCRDAGAGAYELTFAKGKLAVSACFVEKGWRFVPPKQGLKTSSRLDGKDLVLSFEATAPAGYVTQDNLPMMVVLSGDYAAYPDALLRMGGKIATCTSRNIWGYGDKLEFDMFDQTLTLGRSSTLSFWKLGKDHAWSIRVQLEGAPQADGSVRYAQTLAFRTGKVKIAKPIDMPALKRVQYLRQLAPPQEPPFDPEKWIAVCRKANASKEDFDFMEDLFDVRSRLCSARDRLKHRPTPDAAGEALVAQGYRALNAMDLVGARDAAERLDKVLVGSEEWMPLTHFAPFGWIKNYTQWGYMRAADGCSYLEPTPWCLEWQDGFKFSIAQDPRVTIANTKGDPLIYTTLYNEPMTDVKVDRDWVSDCWQLSDGRRVTFSVLTPVVDVENTDTLTLGGFDAAPDVLVYTTPSARPRYLRLTKDVVIEPEIVPSVLMDFKAKPPPPVAATCGELAIDPADVARPWLMLYSKLGGWRLLLYPGARPVSAAWQNGVFTLKLEKKSYVGVMRAMNNLHECEHAAIAEFFAGTQTAPPITCREEVSGRTNRWHYGYRLRENAWGTPLRRIAPVPPLADFADCSFAGAKTVKYPTKWNLFRYVEGETAAMTLPADLRREPSSLLGVNVGYPIDVEKADAVVTNGAKWIRLVCPRDKTITIPEQCGKLAAALDYCRSRKVRVLLDAHNFNYRIDWSAGADPKTIGDFYAVWEALSKVAARYGDILEGYDLYNEPGLVAGSEGLWREICEKAVRIIRRNHPGAKVYYPAVYGGNPNGLFNLEPLSASCEPQVVTYHFYTPHSFSHQKMDTQNRGNDVCNYFPSWTPPIDWVAGNHWGGPSVTWHDRWTIAALLLPAFEHYAQFGVPMHVGEFGIIGFANRKSSHSAFLWTRDTIELFRHVGTSWHIWNGGFGLCNPLVRDYVYDLWRKE